MQMTALSFLNFLWMCSEADHCTSNLWPLATNQLLCQNEIVNHFVPPSTFFLRNIQGRQTLSSKGFSHNTSKTWTSAGSSDCSAPMFHRGSSGVHAHVSRFTFPTGQSVQMNFWSANYTQDWIEALLFSIDFLLLLPAWLDHIQSVSKCSLETGAGCDQRCWNREKIAFS